MYRFFFATALVIAPTAAFGQSTGTAASEGRSPGSPAPVGAGVYGPPAPVAALQGSSAPAARSKPATDAAQAPARHRNRRKGAYAGADLGAGR